MVSEGEAQALEDAASMLDEKRLPEGALPDLDAPVDTPVGEADGALSNDDESSSSATDAER